MSVKRILRWVAGLVPAVAFGSQVYNIQTGTVISAIPAMTADNVKRFYLPAVAAVLLLMPARFSGQRRLGYLAAAAYGFFKVSELTALPNTDKGKLIYGWAPLIAGGVLFFTGAKSATA